MNKCLFFAVVVAAAALAVASRDVFDVPTVPTRESLEDGVIFMGARPTYDETQFVGKNVFITGGSSGIGFATALTFARFGANVIICSRDSNSSWFNGTGAVARIEKDEIVQQKNGHIRWIKADVANKTSISALFKQLEDEHISIDLAVNNAGIIGPDESLMYNTEYFGTQYDCILNNLVGTVNCLELEIDHFMKEKKDGAIVNLASLNSYRACPGCPMYAASKHGIASLTRSVGTEYASTTPSIRINAIAPGFTNTSLVWQQAKLQAHTAKQAWEGDYITPDSELWQKWKQHYLDMCPNGRFADPLEQANGIAFLLAKESELITGSVMSIDGAEFDS